MKIIKSGQFALIIDSNGQADEAEAGNVFNLDAAVRGAGPCGHFVFDRYSVDNNGYIRLTSTLPLSDLSGYVEMFGAELESLLRQAQARYAGVQPPPAQRQRSTAK